MAEFDPTTLRALMELHEELSKTVMLSEGFKDYIIQKTIEAVGEGVAAQRPDEELLQQEFAARQFIDKAIVKLRVRTVEELVVKLDSDVRLRGFALFIKKHFQVGNPMDRILLGSYEELVAFREWFWMEINENPDEFAQLAALGEWDTE